MPNVLSRGDHSDAVNELRTAGEVVLALGGPAAIARALETSTQNVATWAKKGVIPSRHFLWVGNELANLSCRVAPDRVAAIFQFTPRGPINEPEHLDD